MKTIGRVAVAAAVSCAMGMAAIPANATAVAGRTARAAQSTRPRGRRLYPTVAGARERRIRRINQAAAAAPLTYGGAVDGIGVTTGTPKVYLVFWGSQWGTASPPGSTNFSNDPAGVAPLVQAMFTGVGTNDEKWSGVMTQYCEGVAVGTITCPSGAPHVAYPTGGALAGIWNDNAVAAPANATEHAIGVEAVSAATHFGNTTAVANRNAQYVVVSPTGTHPDGFNTLFGNFCAWHDWNGDTTFNGGGAVPSSVGDIAFTNLPYVPDAGAGCGANYVNAGAGGALDGVTIVAGHEYAETITDQNPPGGWTDSSGAENADKCAWVGTGGTGGAQNVAFADGSFAMQGTWSNESGACAISHPIVGAPTDDFSISVSPSSVSVVAGSTAAATVSTATTSGSPQTVALSASGLPTGMTASFAPTSVTSGSSASLTLSASASTVNGTYTVTISGSGTTTHSTSVAVTVTGGAAPNDFSIGVAPSSASVAAGSSASVTVSTATTSGSAQMVALSASGLPSGVTASFAPSSVTSGGSASLTFSASAGAASGTSTVTVSGTGNVTHTATVALTVTTSSTISPLTNGVPVSGISGATGSQQFWKLDVPAGQDAVTFTTSGGTGDVDLYVRVGAVPTTSAYNCRPYLYGNNETCTFTAPTAGTYYVLLNGYAAYAGVTLKATYTATTALANGVPVTGVSGATGSQQFWKLDVPAGQSAVVFTISGGTGDADLYVRRSARPTTLTYDCRPYLYGNNETCNFSAPVAGTYYVMLRGYAAYSGVTLRGTYSVTAPVLVNGVPVTGIAGALGSQQFWKLSVPAAQGSVVFTISGGSGDADLYVQFGAKPTTISFICRPFLIGNNETCTITAPSAGDYYVMLNGYAAYTGVTLTGAYS